MYNLIYEDEEDLDDRQDVSHTELVERVENIEAALEELFDVLNHYLSK